MSGREAFGSPYLCPDCGTLLCPMVRLDRADGLVCVDCAAEVALGDATPVGDVRPGDALDGALSALRAVLYGVQDVAGAVHENYVGRLAQNLREELSRRPRWAAYSGWSTAERLVAEVVAVRKGTD